MIKINYGSKPLGKNERRPTVQEAVDKGQVRYFGLMAITDASLEEGKRKKLVKAPISISKYARDKLEKEILALISQIQSMEDSLEWIKGPNQVAGVKQLIKEQKQLLNDLFKKQAEQIKQWDVAGKPITLPRKAKR